MLGNRLVNDAGDGFTSCIGLNVAPANASENCVSTDKSASLGESALQPVTHCLGTFNELLFCGQKSCMLFEQAVDIAVYRHACTKHLA